MKKIALLVAALFVLSAPTAFAMPLLEAGSPGVHPAELSLPGLAISDVASLDQPDLKLAQGTERLHPAQLSLQGEVVEDVLAPQATTAGESACRTLP